MHSPVASKARTLGPLLDVPRLTKIVEAVPGVRLAHGDEDDKDDEAQRLATVEVALPLAGRRGLTWAEADVKWKAEAWQRQYDAHLARSLYRHLARVGLYGGAAVLCIYGLYLLVVASVLQGTGQEFSDREVHALVATLMVPVFAAGVVLSGLWWQRRAEQEAARAAHGLSSNEGPMSSGKEPIPSV